MHRSVTPSVLLAFTLAGAHALPVPRHTSPNVLPHLRVPQQLDRWTSREVSQQLNLQDPRYSFISHVIARLYVDQRGSQVLLLVLDARNFHHPKVCFTGSGFAIHELEDMTIVAAGRKFSAHALHAEKRDQGFLVIYWMTIDGRHVEWTEQKLKQVWFSLTNRQQVGLMVRLDIPTDWNHLESAKMFARDFLSRITEQLPERDLAYLLGQPD